MLRRACVVDPMNHNNNNTASQLHAALAEYETTFLAGRNYAAETRRKYVADLSHLLTFLDGLGVHAPTQVSRQHLEGYLAFLDRAKLAGATRRRKVAAIRSFFGSLQDQGTVPL